MTKLYDNTFEKLLKKRHKFYVYASNNDRTKNGCRLVKLSLMTNIRYKFDKIYFKSN